MWEMVDVNTSYKRGDSKRRRACHCFPLPSLQMTTPLQASAQGRNVPGTLLRRACVDCWDALLLSVLGVAVSSKGASWSSASVASSPRSLAAQNLIKKGFQAGLFFGRAGEDGAASEDYCGLCRGALRRVGGRIS